VTQLASDVLNECTADDGKVLGNRLEILVEHLPRELAGRALGRLRALPDGRGPALVRHLADHLSDAVLRGVLTDIRDTDRSRAAHLLEKLVPHLPASLLADVCRCATASSARPGRRSYWRSPGTRACCRSPTTWRRASGTYRAAEILAQLSIRLRGPDRLTRAREALAAARGRQDTVALMRGSPWHTYCAMSRPRSSPRAGPTPAT
jgi:hypothetical protein